MGLLKDIIVTAKPKRVTLTVDAETKKRFADACRAAGVRQSAAVDAAIADATAEINNGLDFVLPGS